jgi:hypothetical protein
MCADHTLDPNIFQMSDEIDPAIIEAAERDLVERMTLPDQLTQFIEDISQRTECTTDTKQYVHNVSPFQKVTDVEIDYELSVDEQMVILLEMSLDDRMRYLEQFTMEYHHHPLIAMTQLLVCVLKRHDDIFLLENTSLRGQEWMTVERVLFNVTSGIHHLDEKHMTWMCRAIRFHISVWAGFMSTSLWDHVLLQSVHMDAETHKMLVNQFLDDFVSPRELFTWCTHQKRILFRSIYPWVMHRCICLEL